MGIKAIFKPIGWVFSKFWWLLDGTRRAILNLLLLVLLIGIAVALINRGPKPLQASGRAGPIATSHMPRAQRTFACSTAAR